MNLPGILPVCTAFLFLTCGAKAQVQVEVAEENKQRITEYSGSDVKTMDEQLAKRELDSTKYHQIRTLPLYNEKGEIIHRQRIVVRPKKK